MNIQSIIVTNGIGCTILVVLLISSYLVRKRKQLLDRLFNLMIVLVGSSCITETISFILDGVSYPYARVIDMLLNSWLYLTVIVTSFVWWMYVDYRLFRSEERIKKIYPYLSIPALIMLFMLCLNPWTEWLFRMDEDLYYQRMPIGYVYLVVMFYHVIGSMVTKHTYLKRYGRTKFFPMFMFLVPIIIGTVLQLFIYGISLAWCGACVGLVGIYMSLQNELSFIDPLTRLYNRNYLDHVLRTIKYGHKTAAGIMIDLDYFKTINDTFGHSVGDEALIDAAEIIRKAVPSGAVAIRYAGDEFIVISIRGSDKEADDMIGMIRNTLSRFNNSQERKYKLSFSIGYSIYEPEKGDTDSFMHRMDESMYEEKRLKHCRCAEPAKSEE